MRALATTTRPPPPAPSFSSAFLAWARLANEDERADAANALGRVFLHSGLAPEQREEVAVAMTALLDDRSLAVRRALAEALAGARETPRRLAVALVNDAPEVAAPLLARSPALTDADLVDCAALGEAVAQCAIARRRDLGAGPAAALAEVGVRAAALALIENDSARPTEAALRRIVERFDGDADIRAAVFLRRAATASLKADLAIADATAFALSATARGRLSAERAARMGRDAQDKTLCEIAAGCTVEDLAALVATLRAKGALNVALLMRSLLGGRIELFAATLADLSGQPYARALGLAQAHQGQGFAALTLKAGLPRHTLPAFRAALAAIDTYGGSGPEGLKLRLIEETAAACETRKDPRLAPILALLWRLAGEAAKAQARDLARQAATARRPLPPGLIFASPANDLGSAATASPDRQDRAALFPPPGRQVNAA